MWSPMAGEGLGQHADPDTLAQTLFNDYDSVDVVSVGDVIVDRVYDLSNPEIDRYREQWEHEDWFPGPGESSVVDSVPDYVNDLDHDLFPGGRGPNQAVAAARSGADTAVCGRTGTQDVLDELTDSGVDLDTLQYNDGWKDSVAHVFVDDSGENRIPCVRNTDGPLDASYIKNVLTEQEPDYVLLNNGEPEGTIRHALDAVASMDQEPTVIFDPAPADGMEQWLSMDCIDILTPNEEEYAALEDELDAYEGTVIRTGADSVTVNPESMPEQTGYAPQDAIKTYRVETPDVDVVDTTGAGDTFNGYLAGSLAQGMDEEAAVECASYAASLSVTDEGAQPAMPTMEDVDAFIAGCR